MEPTEDTKDNCLYFDITKQERDSAIRYLLGSIIKSRQDSQFPSNYYVFDEDVNVYLAHLLFAVSLPEYNEMAQPYLSLDTNEILKWVRATEDRTIRYFIFKVNADHLLIHTAIFEDLERRTGSKILKKSPKHFRELAKLYYDQAAVYHTRIYRKRTGVGEVLEKLSQYFDAYQGLLKTVRREYFDFVTGFKDQAFKQFMSQIQNYENSFQRQERLDAFLDAYGRWLKTRDRQVEAELQKRILELRQVDPDFKFDWTRIPQERSEDDERKCA